ncbi:conserved hypothetical protein [sediment metagenome]|uniref:Uncharacterized protein n=1 Tax=sediment metagenome TaxID=749907 RepID=D9PI78_9ZZZZ
MDFNFKKWRESKHGDGKLIYDHTGNISTELIINVIDEMGVKMAGDSSGVRRNLSQILIEALQNIFHHRKKDVKEHHEDYETFIIVKNNGSYRLTTGNFIDIHSIKDLKNRIDMINQLSPEEVKSLFKIMLNNNVFSDKGGAGLGIIDIAKRSAHRLNYCFYPVDKNYYFFSLDIEIR